MIPAERWYENNIEYKRYGLDMKERKPRPVRETRSVIALRSRVKMIALLILAGFLGVCVIISAAYSANIRVEINALNRSNAALMGEIQNLNVSIKNATNIRTIEERAINELGMVYPPPEQFIFLSRGAGPRGDFAMRLIEQAYN